ncbi:lipopolysaccharide biosynthesis protein [Hyphomicrobium sp. 99]|uniref:lipopolysaccharide biosynthesis protein n=1 Tax=Hyphomicrobium sp. 99 TaxID=1163419 RepID=UPI001FD8A3A7|nr:lipopolysaccharide biosynthesis protein [Hyphomicrobium sp. 99]
MSTVFGALKSKSRWLVPLSIALGGVTFGVLTMMAPRYQSEVELAIVAKGASSTFSDPRSQSSGPDLVTTRMDKEAINTHVRALQSPDLMQQIANDLKLNERREFNSALGPVDQLDAALRMIGIGGPRSGESERDRVMSAFRSRLEVYTAKESRFIGVRMTSLDPALAAKIANALAENYRSSLAEQGVTEIDDLQTVLKAKIDKLSAEVANAETEIDRYRGKIDGFRGGSQNTGLNEQQMSDLTAELTRAKTARGEAEARAASAREMMKAGAADALADVQKSPLIQNLVQQRVRIERQISELSATLLPGHPRMRQLNADLAGLKLQINSEIGKIVASLEKEAKVAQGRETSIAQSLADIKARVVTNAPEEAQLRQLEANAKAKRTELENIQAQLEANRKKLDARAQPVEAQIISKAQAESVPIFPKKVQLSSLVAFASFMFGTAWIVMGALFQTVPPQGYRKRNASDRRNVEPVLNARSEEPLITEIVEEVDEAAIPETPPISIPGPAPAPELAAPIFEMSENDPPPAASNDGDMEALAERIKVRRTAGGGYRTLITGETDEIVPYDEAVELVKALAKLGTQPILVDWSPSGEGLAREAGLDMNAGFNDLLVGTAGFDEIIQRLPGSNAHVVASGHAFSGDESEIEVDRLNLVLDALDEAYDHIVVVGRHDEAKRLFEGIEGRFDAGIAVASARRSAPETEVRESTFLGFEVAEIDVIRYERQEVAPARLVQRLARVMPQHAPMVRQA